MGSGLNLSGYESDYASNTKSNFRKAGDAFTTASNKQPSKESSYSKWMSFMGNQSSNSSNNSNTTTNSNNSQTTSNTNTAAPQAIQPEAGIAESGIDFKAWAEESVANDPTSAAAGADAAWWEKTYRRNNDEYEQNKALMASHQGPKTWDELADRSKARSGTGDVVSRNTGSIGDYESYTKYATAQQSVKEYEKASSKYQI
jgi:hypothetical protein